MSLLKEKKRFLIVSAPCLCQGSPSQSKGLLRLQGESSFHFGGNVMLSCQVRQISNVNLSRKRLANISLSCPERSVILGSLLGDGSLKIYPGYKNARFSFRHSEKQSAYFFYKVDLLSGIKSSGSVQRQAPDGWSSLGKIRYQSRALPALSEIHNVTHKNNKLEIRRKWLNHLTAHSLAIWWFDDGSIISGGRRGVLCTDGFSEAECLLLAKYLLVVWKINARVGRVSKRPRKVSLSTNKAAAPLSPRREKVLGKVENGLGKAWGFSALPRNTQNSVGSAKSPPPFDLNPHERKGEKSLRLQENNYYRLWLSTEQLKSFLRIILPYVPCKEMLYKVLLTYKDLQLQERWISEVEKGCPQDLKPFLASCFEEIKKKTSENDIVQPL